MSKKIQKYGPKGVCGPKRPFCAPAKLANMDKVAFSLKLMILQLSAKSNQKRVKKSKKKHGHFWHF